MEEESLELENYLESRHEYYLEKDKGITFVKNLLNIEDIEYRIDDFLNRNLDLHGDYFLEIILTAFECSSGKISRAKIRCSNLVETLKKVNNFQRIIDLSLYLGNYSKILELDDFLSDAQYMLGHGTNRSDSIRSSVIDMTLNPYHFLKSKNDFTSLFELYQLIDKLDFLKAFIRAAPLYRYEVEHRKLLENISLDFETVELRSILNVQEVKTIMNQDDDKVEFSELESLKHVLNVDPSEGNTVLRSCKLVEIANLRERIFSGTVNKEIIKNSLYEMGRLYEELDELVLARKLYLKVLAIDDSFRRVKERLLEIDKS